MYNLAHINNFAQDERAGCFTLVKFLLPSGICVVCLILVVPWSMIDVLPDHTYLFPMFLLQSLW